MRINMDNDWKFFLGDVFPKNSTDGWGGQKREHTALERCQKHLMTVCGEVWIFHMILWWKVTIHKRKCRVLICKKSPKWRAWTAVILPAFVGGRYCMVQKNVDIPQDCENKRIYIHFDGVYRNCTIYLNEYYIGKYEADIRVSIMTLPTL